MNVTAIILAGGKSARMGEDKGLMLFEGKAMIEHIIKTVKPLVQEIIIIANNKEYDQFGYPVFEDIIKEKGPLAGILTGLQQSTSDHNLVLSCDTPFVNKELLKLVLTHLNNYDVVIPEKENRTHQLIGAYNKACARVINAAISKNELKIRLAIEELNVKIVDANHIDERIFHNINTKEDAKA
jgi:molybdopterin-guanine dinucleotide biosynthesis protein A